MSKRSKVKIDLNETTIESVDNYYFLDSNGNITFAMLYDEIPYFWRDFYKKLHNGIGKGGIKDVDSLISEVKINFDCKSLDYFYRAGRLYLYVNHKESNKIIKIIQYFINLGHRLFLNDGSELTINIDNCPKYNWKTREVLLLKKYTKTVESDFVWKMWKYILSYDLRLVKRYKNENLQKFCLKHFPKENNVVNLMTMKKNVY